jgi:hypothetical protein
VPKLILDSNLIVVFVIGTMDPQWPGHLKRVRDYRPEDYQILYLYISLLDEVVLLPNTLTEASNLLNHKTGIVGGYVLRPSQRWQPAVANDTCAPRRRRHCRNILRWV